LGIIDVREALASTFGTMLRKKSPRLAAAFVVTISAGCGSAAKPPDHGTPDMKTPPPDATGTTGETPDVDKKPQSDPSGPNDPNWVPNIGAVKEGFIRGADGKCFIQHPANPPWHEPADCETQKPLPKADTATPAPTNTATNTPKAPVVDESNLPDAPAGWEVMQNADGGCRAFKHVTCAPNTRCNPPPPKKVKCPPNMPKKQ
jgi:hypothetical protein